MTRAPGPFAHMLNSRRDTCQTCPSLVRFRTRPDPVCPESWRAPWSRATGLPPPSYSRPLTAYPSPLTLRPPSASLPHRHSLSIGPHSFGTHSPFSSLRVLTTRALLTPPRTRVHSPPLPLSSASCARPFPHTTRALATLPLASWPRPPTLPSAASHPLT